jgi:hypothetical protein
MTTYVRSYDTARGQYILNDKLTKYQHLGSFRKKVPELLPG